MSKFSKPACDREAVALLLVKVSAAAKAVLVLAAAPAGVCTHAGPAFSVI
jgi:hypothetical protein